MFALMTVEIQYTSRQHLKANVGIQAKHGNIVLSGGMYVCNQTIAGHRSYLLHTQSLFPDRPSGAYVYMDTVVVSAMIYGVENSMAIHSHISTFSNSIKS